jgi:uncharacterized radical SAM protein YgiQ
MNKGEFLPLTRECMTKRNWQEVDVLFITGDAYVDHPSFANALIGRLIESLGYKVGLVAQPRWTTLEDVLTFGKPRLCCFISSGNLDSMVNHYTANRRLRSDDAYSGGGLSGKRPDRALITYTNLARQAFGEEIPIIIGGIEASLRKFAHYDYWNDYVRRSILLDSKADLLIYGMGELQVTEILKRLSEGKSDLYDIPGTTFSIAEKEKDLFLENYKEYKIVTLPSYEKVSSRDKKSNTPTKEGKFSYAEAVQLELLNENPYKKFILMQQSKDRYVVSHRPMRPLNQSEFDKIQTLPYQRTYHPIYEKLGGVPALLEVQFSITSNRGCFGSCTFCAITSHQGRIITNRSIPSLINETKEILSLENFKGYINDLGGPTANFQDFACAKQKEHGACQKKQCLFPTPCKELLDSHPQYIERLEAVEKIKGVKKVFIRSGLRYDYLLATGDKNSRLRFIRKLAKDHVSGQLRVAPEHIDANALDMMGKPKVEYYEEFKELFDKTSQSLGKKQYCLPYLITGHPGTTVEGAVNLAEYLSKSGFIPEQVQEFYPTPGTVATAIYYTQLDMRVGRNFEKVHVPSFKERKIQKALLHFHKKENKVVVRQALIDVDRKDLIPLLVGHKYKK